MTAKQNIVWFGLILGRLLQFVGYICVLFGPNFEVLFLWFLTLRMSMSWSESTLRYCFYGWLHIAYFLGECCGLQCFASLLFLACYVLCLTSLPFRSFIGLLCFLKMLFPTLSKLLICLMVIKISYLFLYIITKPSILFFGCIKMLISSHLL